MHDLRFAVRQLLKTPGFTLVAVLTLALGIGANTAIFSIVNALLLRPLPYRDAGRLVQVAELPNGGGFGATDGGVFTDWESQTTQLEAIAAQHAVNKNFTSDGDVAQLSGIEVSARYLSVLGIKPVLGRDFAPEEDAPGGNRHVIILTHELWQSRFGGDPAVLGRALAIDGDSFTVIGVLPPRALINPTVLFLTPATIRADAYKLVRNYNYVCFVIGRLKPGATIEGATAELVTARAAINSQYPAFKQNWSVGIRSLQEAFFGNSRPFALTLLAAVGAILLIACANVANLLLARAASRQGEIAMRIALGASTGRIVRQLMTESMLLAVAGGLAGTLFGAWAIEPLKIFTQLSARAPGLVVDLDARVFAFTLGATVLTGMIFGLIPALSTARPNINQGISEATRGSSSAGRRRAQSFLIVAETALTVVLLACAGLLLRSFQRAFDADAGFDRGNVLVFSVTQPGRKAPTVEHRLRFAQDILRRVGEVPGVAHVGIASSTPMNGRIGFGDFVSREDQPATRNDLNAGFDSVDGDYFQALRIPLLRGRFFTAADNNDRAPRVMIVNEALALRLFPDRDPLGQLLHFKNAAWEIVGVVGSVRQFQLDVNPVPQVYLPEVHFPWSTTVVVRTHVPPLTLADDMRRAVLAVDPEQPIANLTSLEQAVEASLQNRRILLTLIGIFATVALALACLGIYGVMAYTVAQRTREIGIRIALGAELRRVVALVLGDAMQLVGLGLLIGVAATYAASRLISAQLYATSGTDPVVLTAVALVLATVALLACWIPVRRAARVNPVEALRAE
ncbi:MAG TPA: ABC transporter permease [Lacunisphaera sp.]|nr:ABC transporter permease [Lacunisphaera sp.]